MPLPPNRNPEAGAVEPGTVAARRPPPPIPLTVITGFLGAGKTTLLNRLLKDPALSDTAVLINEFGEIGLDHLLVERVDDGIVMLSSGCLCCTVRGDLVTALEKLLRDRDNGRVAFRRAVIETTGLADPAPVLHTIMAHPYLVMRFRLDGVVTLVDAVNGAATLDAHPEAVKQAAVADRLVLTKMDLLSSPEPVAVGSSKQGRAASYPPPAQRWGGSESGASATLSGVGGVSVSTTPPTPDPSPSLASLAGGGEKMAPRLEELLARLRALNPAAPILDAAKGEATAENLLGCGLYDPDGKTPDVRRWLADEAIAAAHDHHDHHDDHHHDHDRNRHDDHIRAFTLSTERLIPHATLDMFLELLRAMHGPNLLRMKGIVGLADQPDRPVVIHGVQHVQHPPATLPGWPDSDRRTRLVFITRDIEPATIENLLSAFLDVPMVDRPDAAALADNPLVPFGGRDR